MYTLHNNIIMAVTGVGGGEGGEQGIQERVIFIRVETMDDKNKLRTLN